MITRLRQAFCDLYRPPTREQNAYDTGFLTGAAAVLGLVLLHRAEARRRARGEAS